MRAGESEPEHCPNGCGPLCHDTYRRQYNELYDAYKLLESSPLAVKLPDRKHERFWSADGFEFDSLGYVMAVEDAIRAAGGDVDA